MSTTNSPASAQLSSPARPVRRLRLWLLLMGAALFASGFLGLERWAYWQERAARTAMAEEHFEEAHRRIDLALLMRERWTSTHLLAARIDRLRGAYSEAEEHLSRCEQLNGMGDQVQLEWLLLRCQQGGYWLERALALDPSRAACHRALIAYYERTNNPAKAAEHRQQLDALGRPR